MNGYKLVAAMVTFSVMMLPAYLLSAFIAQALDIGEWPIWLRFIDAVWALFVGTTVWEMSRRHV